MKARIITSLLIIIFTIISNGQSKIKVSLVGSVDTTNTEINNVFNLFRDYIRSNPDSTYYYDNPYWDKTEKLEYLNAGSPYFDNASGIIFRADTKANYIFSIFTPKVLSIEKLDSNLFSIKTLFYSNKYAEDPTYGKWNPYYITKHYCVKKEGDYYLKNAISYETSFWNKYRYNQIEYIVHPSMLFDSISVKKTIKFIEKTCQRYNLTIPKQISYYVAPSSEEVGKLFNFTFNISPFGSMANTHLFRIITLGENFNNIHEITHLIFNQAKWNDKTRPFIINEGLATFLGGTKGELPFLEELKIFSKEIKQEKDLTLNSIIQRKYSHDKDNNPIYITGAYIFYKVYNKHGAEGVVSLFNCGKTDFEFQKMIEKLFNMSYEKFNVWIIEQLRQESQNVRYQHNIPVQRRGSRVSHIGLYIKRYC